jgi:hypothetical protein
MDHVVAHSLDRPEASFVDFFDFDQILIAPELLLDHCPCRPDSVFVFLLLSCWLTTPTM